MVVIVHLFNRSDLCVGSITANILATLVVWPKESFMTDKTKRIVFFNYQIEFLMECLFLQIKIERKQARPKI